MPATTRFMRKEEKKTHAGLLIVGHEGVRHSLIDHLQAADISALMQCSKSLLFDKCTQEYLFYNTQLMRGKRSGAVVKDFEALMSITLFFAFYGLEKNNKIVSREEPLYGHIDRGDKETQLKMVGRCF